MRAIDASLLSIRIILVSTGKEFRKNYFDMKKRILIDANFPTETRIVLLDKNKRSSEGVPDYNALVCLEKID